MLKSIRWWMTPALLVLLSMRSSAAQNTATGTIQGTVKRAGASEIVSGAEIRLEGGPADPKSVQELIRGAAGRGVIFTPQRIGTVDEVLQDVIDVAAAQGVGPGFPAFQAALNTFKDANLARFTGSSDNEGKFTIKSIPAGHYIVHASREGFIDPSTLGTPLRVDIANGEIANVEVAMMPGGVVGGHIRDAAGKTMRNIDVQAVSLTYQNGYPFLQAVMTKPTDDQGEFRLFWLQPGDYYIAAAIRPAANPGGIQQRVFYPSALEMTNASPLTIRSGDQISGIDIQLRDDHLYTISGQVTSTIPPEETAAMAAVLNPPAVGQPTLLLTYRDPNMPDPSRNVGTVMLNPVSGKFETIGLLPGAYELYARIPESNVNGGAGLAWGHVPVDIQNQNTGSISITVNPSVNVRGTVTVDGRQPPNGTPLRIALLPTGSNTKIGVYNSVAQRPVTAGADGSFTMIGVPPGLWRVDLGAGLPPDLYIADVRQGSMDILDTGFEVRSTPPDPIQVMFCSGAGTVNGTVQDANGKPSPGATVVLVPPPARRDSRVLYRTATADAAGKFTIRSVTPGSFKLFAWQQAVPGGAYFNARFMSKYENLGRSINVMERSTITQQMTAIP